jgi:hypothetical protein
LNNAAVLPLEHAHHNIAQADVVLSARNSTTNADEKLPLDTGEGAGHICGDNCSGAFSLISGKAREGHVMAPEHTQDVDVEVALLCWQTEMLDV